MNIRLFHIYTTVIAWIFADGIQIVKKNICNIPTSPSQSSLIYSQTSVDGSLLSHHTIQEVEPTAGKF